jgi:hypothetical protein
MAMEKLKRLTVIVEEKDELMSRLKDYSRLRER